MFRPFFISNFIFFLFFLGQLPAQDLYDFAHSKAYAKYLLSSRQFDLAVEEYERLLFFQPENDSLRYDLLQALRQAGQAEKAISQWKKWEQKPDFRPKSMLFEEKTRIYLSSGQTKDALNLLKENELLSQTFQQKNIFFCHFLDQNWTEARSLFPIVSAQFPPKKRTALENLIQNGEQLKLKKPWLAAGMSTLVPGTGKAYAGQWKDGLISFVFVGLNSWQSYRRFHREGLKSPWGWIHGGLAAGFYIGNIYGSHKAARHNNERKKLKLQQQCNDTILPLLD